MDLRLEDDEDLGQAVVDHLVAAGHCLRWYRCMANADAAAPWEMALPGLRLGDGDGVDLLRRWRKASRPDRPQPPLLRIQSAVPKKLSASFWASAGSTDWSAIACTMQPSHWSRSAMPMAYGKWRARKRGWPKRSV